MTRKLVCLPLVAILLALLLGCGKEARVSSGDGRRDKLTVLSYNLWHGLNPTSSLKFSEYETPEQREVRLQGFLVQARALDPDIIMLQEVNPAPGLTERIAEELGLDGVSAVVNAGVKIGSVGLPVNLRSGMAILAKKDLHLHDLGSQKLSGGFGRSGKWIQIQFGEFRYAHAASVVINGDKYLIMNCHLHHGMELTDDIRKRIEEMVASGELTDAEAKRSMAIAADAVERRRDELEKALEFAVQLGMSKAPTLFAGDFNASPDSPELTWLKKDAGFVSATGVDGADALFYTWDPTRNVHTHHDADFEPANEYEAFLKNRLGDYSYDLKRRLDYIFLRNIGDLFHVTDSGLFGDRKFDGEYASDHFGVFAMLETAGKD